MYLDSVFNEFQMTLWTLNDGHYRRHSGNQVYTGACNSQKQESTEKRWNPHQQSVEREEDQPETRVYHENHNSKILTGTKKIYFKPVSIHMYKVNT